MILRVKGKAVNVETFIVGKVTRDYNKLDKNTFLIAENSIPEVDFSPACGMLTNLDYNASDLLLPSVFNIPSFDHLHEGDIVSVNSLGNVRTLYRVNSYHNIIFATERCNSNCLMCSQPPKDKNDIPELYKINEKLISLIPKDCFELCITGGEPTLMGDLFFQTLKQLKEELPNTEIHLLTNGRSFAWPQMVERLVQIDYKRLMLGVPLYADYYQVHDYIVQAKDAFFQTITGLHNLASYNQRIEIRVVLHKQSIPRLTRLARYIYKNLPFAEHVTFMGLEFIGYTPHILKSFG
jgi:His-Xaa-Ser system radical SAM maturase HxsC